MVCIERCNRRLLCEADVKLPELASLEILRSRISSDHVELGLKKFDAEVVAEVRRRATAKTDEVSVLIAVAMAVGALPVYVKCETTVYALRPAAFSDCTCLCPIDIACHARFYIKRSLMLHGSPEVEMDGRAVYARERDFLKALHIRPTCERRVKQILKDLLDKTHGAGRTPTTAELIKLAINYPEVRGVSERRLRELLNSIKPDEMKRPGRRAIGRKIKSPARDDGGEHQL